jgi:hypothetical protein
MSKYIKEDPLPFAVIKKYRDNGGEAVLEYFKTKKECKNFIKNHKKHFSYKLLVGEYV